MPKPKSDPVKVDDRPPPRKPSARSSAKAKRSAARLTAVQVLYQAALNEQTPLQTLAEFADYRIGQIVDDLEIVPADMDTLTAIVTEVAGDQPEIDRIMASVLRGTTPERLELLMRCAMRAGIAELKLRRDIAAGIIISDYLSVIEAFYSAGPEIKLINAAMDAAARQIRGNDLGAVNEI